MDIYVTHPKNQRYYKNVAFISGLLAMNNHYWVGFPLPKMLAYRLERITVMIMSPLVTISSVVYLVLNHSEHEFESLSMMYAILPVATIVTIKIGIAQTQNYRRAMEDFMTKIHLYSYYVKNKSPYVKKTLIETEKITRLSMIYLLCFCYTCWAGFEIVPIIHNIQNNESIHNITTRLEIICHIWLPFDYEFNFRNWLIVQIMMFYGGFYAISVVAFFDMQNLMFLYHMIGHIKIFKEKLRHVFRANMSEEEIKSSIIETSNHYTFLIKTLHTIQKALGFNVACIYLHNLFAGGLFIYQLSRSGTDIETILTYGLSIPLYMGILVIISFALEAIRTAAEEIPDMIYSLNWEDMSIKNQKMMLNVLCQVQPVMEFNAAFNIKTGVEPAVAIIKTTFSFYVMIKSTV